MKRIGITLFFILILAACGQGEQQGTGSEPNTDGIETDTNEDLIVDEDNTDEDPEADDQENETAIEDEIDVNDNQGNNEDGTSEETSTKTIEIVFSDDQVMDMYRVEREIEATGDDLQFAKAALEAWIAGPTEEGLVSLLPEGVKVDSITDEDGIANVSLSKEFLNAQVGSGTEAMIYQQIALIMNQFGYQETLLLIEGEVHDEMFGHIMTNEPIESDELDNYEKYDN